MKRIVVPGLFGIAAYFVVFGGEYSILDVRHARAEYTVEVERLAELTAINDSLGAWADMVEADSATIERLARERFGMIRDGEILYRFTEPEPADDSVEPADDSGADPGR